MEKHYVDDDGMILQGDVVESLRSIQSQSVDAIFADPPYFLQLENELRRPDDSRVVAVNDEWDNFSSFDEYDRFTGSWLSECRRVLKAEGTIWVIGTYHNIYRVGRILQDLGFWILNDVIWVKANPMPNFRGTRFTNAHETLIWAKHSKGSGYTFNYWDMKSLNDGVQMRSDWVIPICSGKERARESGTRAHSTQKPLALLYRIITSSTNRGDTILDPFLGSGTTAVAARTLGRRWIGVEKDSAYIELSMKRVSEAVSSAAPADFSQALTPYPSRRHQDRVAFGSLVERGLLRPGQFIYSRNGGDKARVNADGSISLGELRGSIHQMSAKLLGRERANGWDYWFYKKAGKLLSIDDLRSEFRTTRSRGKVKEIRRQHKVAGIEKANA